MQFEDKTLENIAESQESRKSSRFYRVDENIVQSPAEYDPLVHQYYFPAEGRASGL